MSQLEKAQLQPVKADGTPDGAAIPVQFNPATLRLQISNQVEGSASRGRQVRQYTGASSTQLTVELIFDTADEGTTDGPVSVRTKTSQVEQFLYPKADEGQKQAPPRLRFEWGDLVVEGVVESLNIDLDHFAANGFPLRAKVGFSLKEQDRRYELKTAGDGANAAGSSTRPGEAGSGSLGSAGGGIAAQVAAALGGESAAEFAARVGLDPSAWRGLSLGASLGGSLSLEAGLEVGFDLGLGASAGLGVFAGASAGASVSLEAAFGLEMSAGLTAVAGVGGSAQLQQGFALSASGGVSAALATVKTAQAEAAASSTKAAFGLSPSSASLGNGAAASTVAPASPGRSTSVSAGTTSNTVASSTRPGPAGLRPALPGQERTPMRLAGVPTPAAQLAAPAAPPPPVADPRAVSFGFGVPLRASVRSESSTSPVLGHPLTASSARGGTHTAPVTHDPTVPAWVALPLDPSATATRSKSTKGHALGPCGCAGPNALKGGS